MCIQINNYTVVPRKWIGSADCDTMYTIYLSLCTQTDYQNLFEANIVCYTLCNIIHILYVYYVCLLNSLYLNIYIMEDKKYKFARIKNV